MRILVKAKHCFHKMSKWEKRMSTLATPASMMRYYISGDELGRRSTLSCHKCTMSLGGKWSV